MECSYVAWKTHDRIRRTLNIMLRCDFIYDSDDFPPSYLSELVGTQALLAFVDVVKAFHLLFNNIQLPMPGD